MNIIIWCFFGQPQPSPLAGRLSMLIGDSMKVGDLVRCIWQPKVSRVEGERCTLLHLPLKGEIGVVEAEPRPGTYFIFFPRFGYRHPLSADAVEVISESR